MTQTLAVLGTHGLTAFNLGLCVAWGLCGNWPRCAYFLAAACINVAVMAMK